MHILVVEDEVALCDTIVRSLKRLAYSVDYCYDGQKALAEKIYKLVVICQNWLDITDSEFILDPDYYVIT